MEDQQYEKLRLILIGKHGWQTIWRWTPRTTHHKALGYCSQRYPHTSPSQQHQKWHSFLASEDHRHPYSCLHKGQKTAQSKHAPATLTVLLRTDSGFTNLASSSLLSSISSEISRGLGENSRPPAAAIGMADSTSDEPTSSFSTRFSSVWVDIIFFVRIEARGYQAIKLLHSINTNFQQQFWIFFRLICLPAKTSAYYFEDTLRNETRKFLFPCFHSLICLRLINFSQTVNYWTLSFLKLPRDFQIFFRFMKLADYTLFSSLCKVSSSISLDQAKL